MMAGRYWAKRSFEACEQLGIHQESPGKLGLERPGGLREGAARENHLHDGAEQVNTLRKPPIIDPEAVLHMFHFPTRRSEGGGDFPSKNLGVHDRESMAGAPLDLLPELARPVTQTLNLRQPVSALLIR